MLRRRGRAEKHGNKKKRQVPVAGLRRLRAVGERGGTGDRPATTKTTADGWSSSPWKQSGQSGARPTDQLLVMVTTERFIQSFVVESPVVHRRRFCRDSETRCRRAAHGRLGVEDRQTSYENRLFFGCSTVSVNKEHLRKNHSPVTVQF